MPGSGQSRDQSEDPRDNTVDLPRIDLAGLADYFRGAAPPPRPAVSAPSPLEQPESPDEPAEAGLATGGLPAPAVRAARASAAPGDPAVARPAGSGPAGESAGVSGPAVFAPMARPVAGSLADLRSRLARLPAGHPSSPYEDSGQARPLPTRLRQLELGLPAPGREQGDGGASHSEVSDSARVLAEVAAEFDLPAEPEQPGPDRDPGNQAGVRNAHDRPAERRHDPQWQDPYAADSDNNRHASLESRPVSSGGPVFGPWSGEDGGLPGPAPGGSRNGNGNGHADARPDMRPADYSPRDDWQDHDRHDHDRSGLGTPPQPEWERHQPQPEWERHQPRPERDRHAEQELHHPRPEQELHHPRPERERRYPRPVPDAEPGADGLAELVERTLTRCQAAEGRNTFGTYGSSGLTPAMRRLAAQLPAGGLAPGSEADSLKPADRFAAKLSRLIARNPARSPADLAETISDAVRYAFTFETADYTEGTWLVHRKLKAHGFELEARRNRWQSPEYKGIFTRWRDPAHGIAFEVQFHTMGSWAVAKRTHDAYSRITDPATPPAERARLRARQVAAAASAKPPPGCMEIADFRGEPR
jgi:hypothetical protein